MLHYFHIFFQQSATTDVRKTKTTAGTVSKHDCMRHHDALWEMFLPGCLSFKRVQYTTSGCSERHTDTLTHGYAPLSTWTSDSSTRHIELRLSLLLQQAGAP
eukprot:5624587-Pleurochrysis_carterae.AAC.12